MVGNVQRTRKPCAYGKGLNGRWVDGCDSEIARTDAAGNRGWQNISIAHSIDMALLWSADARRNRMLLTSHSAGVKTRLRRNTFHSSSLSQKGMLHAE